MKSVALFTSEVGFAGDMADVIRVFWGAITLFVNEEAQTDYRFEHTITTRGNSWHCRFVCGDVSFEMTDEKPEQDERGLLEKRYKKRLIKKTLYGLMKQLTGIQPDWGSLTGIRPTRLLYERERLGDSLEGGALHLEKEFDLAPEKARLLLDIVRVQKEMPQPDPSFVDVYVGVPFCRTRCAYCSFLSGEIGKGKQVPPYLTALFHEMEETARIIRETGLKLRAVYMGGGTPTSLNEEQFASLMEQTQKYFGAAGEITVEAGRPDTITRAKLEAIRDAGVHRISINPQTMNDRTLQIIGRAHTSAETVAAYELARSLGFEHINMDVIAGLPGEDPEDFAVTMDWALRLHPESLTVHTLAIKRSSILHLQNAQLPDGDMTAHMVRMGYDTAMKLGLRPYYLYRQKYMAGNQENVGYAKPGYECVYNVDMMEETTHILSVGAGAMSKRIYENEGRIERAPNVSDISEYISRVDEMVERKRSIFRDMLV